MQTPTPAPSITTAEAAYRELGRVEALIADRVDPLCNEILAGVREWIALSHPAVSIEAAKGGVIDQALDDWYEQVHGEHPPLGPLPGAAAKMARARELMKGAAPMPHELDDHDLHIAIRRIYRERPSAEVRP